MTALAQILDNAAVEAINTVLSSYAVADEAGGSNIAAVDAVTNTVKFVLNLFATAFIETEVAAAQGTYMAALVQITQNASIDAATSVFSLYTPARDNGVSNTSAINAAINAVKPC